MHYSIFKRLGLGECTPKQLTLQLPDRSYVHPRGVLEDLHVKVGPFIFPADFVILDIEEDKNFPWILCRPFLATGRALIDVEVGELIMRFQTQHIVFNVFESMKYPSAADDCFL